MSHNFETRDLDSVDSNLAHLATPASEAVTDRRHIASRRNDGLHAFFYGNIRPRRRSSRRSSDQHLLWFDWHEPRILYLALGVLLLSCTDALFTLNLLSLGATEANVFMAYMLNLGIDQFVISKICITSFSVITLCAAARMKFVGPFSVEHLLQFFLVGYLLLICYEIYLFLYVFGLNL